nr:MAG TPA: hypothetical protein [Caudoviricetes sp.]
MFSGRISRSKFRLFLFNSYSIQKYRSMFSRPLLYINKTTIINRLVRIVRTVRVRTQIRNRIIKH